MEASLKSQCQSLTLSLEILPPAMWVCDSAWEGVRVASALQTAAALLSLSAPALEGPSREIGPRASVHFRMRLPGDILLPCNLGRVY